MKAQARYICTQLRAHCQAASVLEGTVHSVFRRVCNLEFPGLPIVSLTTESIPVKPWAAQLQGPEVCSFQDLPIQQGDPVRYEYGFVLFPAADLQVSLAGAQPVDCGMAADFPVSGQISQEKRAQLRQCLLSAHPAGVLPLLKIWEPQLPIPDNPVSDFLKERVSRLFDAALSGDLQVLAQCSGQVAGCGPGLTPSSDDLLIGLMASLLYTSFCYGLSLRRARAINQALIAGARGKTLRLSYEMMQQSADGCLTQDLHLLLRGLCQSAPCSIEPLALRVLDYGETSGSDTLTGIYLGILLADGLRLRELPGQSPPAAGKYRELG
jgi:hypothetical protein